MLKIDFDVKRFEHDSEIAMDALVDGCSHGLDRAADVYLQEKRRKIRRTYNREIPTDDDGNPQWERSGDWRDNQEVQKTGTLERTITTTGNAANYERRLSNLPTGAGGINRTNKATDDAKTVFEPQFPEIMEAAIKTEFKKRGVS